MGTSANIILKNKKELYVSGVWFNGGKEDTGKYLKKYYNTKEKVEELINLGIISSIHKTIDEIVSNEKRRASLDNYETPWEERKPAKKETKINIFNCKTIYDFLDEEDADRVWTDPSFMYVFDIESNKWFYKKINDEKYKPL